METFEPSHEGKVQYFLRPNSDKIQIRFSITERGKSVQKKRSTGETTYPRARKAADKIYTELLVASASGASTNSRKFRSVAKAYLKEVHDLTQAGEKSDKFLKEETSRVERYLVGFFGDKAITNIRQSDIDKYVMWRTTYWTTGPGKDISTRQYKRGAQTITSPVKRGKPTLGTLHSDINCIRRLFAFAKRERYIDERDSFKIEAPKGHLEKRAKFSYAEIDQLLGHLADRMLEPYQKHETTLKRYHLYLFAEIASGSGMRPGEIISLRWNQIIGMHKGHEISLIELIDVPWSEQDIRINVRDTKRGRIRTVRPIDGVGSRIMNLWDIADRPMGDEPLFVCDALNPVASFNRSLARELDRLGIRYDKMGRPRSANSFRHYYITRMLRKVRSASIVAQNVGTRVENIERFYLNDDVEEFADELSGFD